MTERINEPPWGRCLQGAVDVRWVVVVVVSSSPRTTSSRAPGSTVTLLKPNGDASMGLDDQTKRERPCVIVGIPSSGLRMPNDGGGII